MVRGSIFIALSMSCRSEICWLGEAAKRKRGGYAEGDKRKTPRFARVDVLSRAPEPGVSSSFEIVLPISEVEKGL